MACFRRSFGDLSSGLVVRPETTPRPSRLSAEGYLGFGWVGLVVAFEQQAPQQFPHAQAIAHLPLIVVPKVSRVRLAAAYHRQMRLRVLAHGDEPIECDPNGCCLWIGRSALGPARRRLYEASRGPLPSTARLENTCERRRCVNLDHLRIIRDPRAPLPSDVDRCQRGHVLAPANVVRHRDGRVAYCKLCRNDRRRQRYANDPTFAQRERLRQRQLRRSTRD